ncbi:5'-methylthioadenosine/S-adenosylhomocysteine nucleosidase family protein [Aeromonas caviae]|uniref:5'-methylthioadenosine/S-adenosylhomocysteine nucleosidase family protein n=1 Tax=Aeromonas caviae TaxID=648 RepID=UPI002B46A1DB|nr:hypothetical protein [Aeromonas caviae]
MTIMLIEDNDSKARNIEKHLINKGVMHKDIIRVCTMTDFAAKLNENIELFIIDCKLPSLDNSAASQNGQAILESIIKSGGNQALLLAISSYPNDFPELRSRFEAHGCILADYSDEKGWKSTLDHLLIQLNKNYKLDFLIFCALQEERNPYITLMNGKRALRGDLDCYDIEINERKGSVILLPQMGLVNAAVIAGLSIERFKPKIICMSGICAGFKGHAKMGQLLISKMAFEYQSGKWISDGFLQEPYQASPDNTTLMMLQTLLQSESLISELESGFQGTRPSASIVPDMGIFTSGSAVISAQEKMDNIKEFHRKVNALDMEVFATMRAAELSPYQPKCICAKTVVDLGDEDKGDSIHSYGSYISAKFIIKSLEQLLA